MKCLKNHEGIHDCLFFPKLTLFRNLNKFANSLLKSITFITFYKFCYYESLVSRFSSLFLHSKRLLLIVYNEDHFQIEF